jgi:hypothetical protein
MPNPWPTVQEDDSGLWPAAGSPRHCFYCGQAVGQEHARDCVTVTKRVTVRYIFDVSIEVPHCWSEEDVRFHRNNSSWCSDNAIGDIREHTKRVGGCLCDSFKCEVLDMTSPEPL